MIDLITPNEVEAAQLVGFAVKTPADGRRAAAALLDLGAKTALVKMGAQGVAVAAPGGSTFIPAFKVRAVDTTAAGDAFNGGMAAALVEGHPLETAVIWGAAAGALSATKVGAQPSMPTRAQFEAFLKENAA